LQKPDEKKHPFFMALRLRRKKREREDDIRDAKRLARLLKETGHLLIGCTYDKSVPVDEHCPICGNRGSLEPRIGPKVLPFTLPPWKTKRKTG
jgi:hypothetical protein